MVLKRDRNGLNHLLDATHSCYRDKRGPINSRNSASGYIMHGKNDPVYDNQEFSNLCFFFAYVGAKDNGEQVLGFDLWIVVDNLVGRPKSQSPVEQTRLCFVPSIGCRANWAGPLSEWRRTCIILRRLYEVEKKSRSPTDQYSGAI